MAAKSLSLEKSMDWQPDYEHSTGAEYVDEHTDLAPPENQWYHGKLDRNAAEDRLRVAGNPGSYLIRESDTGSYVLSYLGKTGFSHFRITAMCGDYYIGGRQFGSLGALIGYYTSRSYLLKEERLLYPVSPPEPVDDRRKVVAIISYTGMLETDELSFETNDIFVVHNELGDGWLWVTSNRTGQEGIVYEDLIKQLDENFDPVESLPYFHPNISKEEATTKLGEAGEGSYLVRRSDNHPGNYTLFCKSSPMVMKISIEKQGRQFFMGGRYFDTIDAIIQRYTSVQILEGTKLEIPVYRESYGTQVHYDMSHSNSDFTQIYQTMRQTSGPNIVKCRTDRIIKTGFLNKKSLKSKRWKNFYFVLSEAEEKLYYFESEKRSKPKDLIDLSYCSLYPVHESLFGRPNCFQLYMDAKTFNHVSVFYLCAQSSDLSQEWYQTLKPYCTNYRQTRASRTVHILKELRSITCRVCQAHNVSSRHPHLYCILYLNHVQVARTNEASSQEIVWSDEFILDDIPPDVKYVEVMVCNSVKRSKDIEIGSTKIDVYDLSGKIVDEWYPVYTGTRCEGVCSNVKLRVQLSYLHEIIMPVEEYNGLKELLLKPSYENVLAVSSVCDNSRVFAKAILQIFRHDNSASNLLKVVNEYEIAKEESKSQLFRTTSLATTLTDEFMKLTATHFVQTALQSTVSKIVECKHFCEMNPDNLEASCDLETNKQQFLLFINEAIESIEKSVISCPQSLRYVCGCIQNSAAQRWPSDESMRTRAVGAFIFLRLLCAALISPKSFNLVTETPSELATRNLKLIAKSLQNLANLVEFGVKESFMKCVNTELLKNRQQIIRFIDDLSNVQKCPKECEQISGDLARDLATVHQICALHLDQLKALSDDPKWLNVKTLVTVCEMLTLHRNRYIEQMDTL